MRKSIFFFIVLAIIYYPFLIIRKFYLTKIIIRLHSYDIVQSLHYVKISHYINFLSNRNNLFLKYVKKEKKEINCDYQDVAKE